MQAILIENIDDLASFSESYHRLLNKVGGIESLYYSLQHIHLVSDLFCRLNLTMFFILVLEGEEVQAVFPFQLLSNRAFGLKTSIQFWGDHNIYAHNVHQKILADGYRPDAMEAAAELLNEELNADWDTIEFKQLKIADENIRYFLDLFSHSDVQLSGEHYYYLSGETNLDEHLGSKQMSNIRRRRRHLERDFGRVNVVLKEQIHPGDIEEIIHIHTRRQEYKNNNGAFFDRPVEHEYMQQLFKLWNRLGCVRYYSLEVEGKPVAIRILTRAGGVVFGFVMAFDSALKKYSPSRLLTYEAFRNELEGGGLQRIETSWGYNRLKKDYSTDRYPLHSVRILNSRIKSKIVHATVSSLIRLQERSVTIRTAMDALRSIVNS